MNRVEKMQGNLSKNELQIIGSIVRYTKYGICEAYKTKSDTSLIKLSAYNHCQELLKRDFSMSNCLD